MRKVEINYNNTENLINNLRTILNGLDDEQRNIKQALGEIYDLENYYRNRNEIIDELEFRERKIHNDIRNTEELIKSIELFSRNVQETDERLAHKFKQDIKSYAKVNNLELVSDFEKWLNKAQTGLDVWGTLSPGPVADGLNGIIYFLRGDMKNGLISLAGIVPYAGDSLKGVKYLDKASDVLKYTDKAVDLKKSSKKISKATDKLNIKDIDFKINSKKINQKTSSNIIDEKKGFNFKEGKDVNSINKARREYDPTKPMSPSNYPNPDPDYSVPPIRYEPKTIEEIKRMRKGKGPTTKATHGDRNIEAHHRGQKSVENGGIIDDLEEYVHRRGGNHTRHTESSELTPAQRAKEIREYWKKRGYESKLPGEDDIK
ncbi:hypothetical protein [Faecalimicrobium sp. JNUCC 81]